MYYANIIFNFEWKNKYKFKFGLVYDGNLILSDCVSEFINFSNNKVCIRNNYNC